MQILYCEQCGTRVDESEAVTVDSKVYCQSCAPKPSTPLRGVKPRSARAQTVQSGSYSGRGTPGQGVKTLRAETVSKSVFVHAGAGASLSDPYQPAVPAWKAWVQRNTALAIALAAGVLGVLILVLWSLFGGPTPDNRTRRASTAETPSISSTYQIPQTTTTTTTPTVSAAPKTVITETIHDQPALLRPMEINPREESAAREFELIKAMYAKGDRFDVRRPLQNFLKSKEWMKKSPMYLEAEKMLAEVPSGARPPDGPADTVPGVAAAAIFGNEDRVLTSDFKPVQTFTFKNVDIKDAAMLKTLTGHDLNVGLRLTGFIEAPTEGEYTFYLNSDDGAYLHIGEPVLVDNGGTHGATERTGVVQLKPGKHSFHIDYYQGVGAAVLTLSWSGPNISKQVVPERAFSSKK